MCTRKGRVVFPRYPLRTTHQPLFFALCFHTVTNPFSRNPFRFTSIQNPGGGGIFCAHLATRHFPFVFISLPPLWPLQKSQPLCNQANPASFCKTPGARVPLRLAWTPHTPDRINPDHPRHCQNFHN